MLYVSVAMIMHVLLTAMDIQGQKSAVIRIEKLAMTRAHDTEWTNFAGYQYFEADIIK